MIDVYERRDLGMMWIVIKRKFLGTVCKLMQSALETVHIWCGAVGDADKITILRFTANKNLVGDFTGIFSK
jgi:hypothetical protein